MGLENKMENYGAEKNLDKIAITPDMKQVSLLSHDGGNQIVGGFGENSKVIEIGDSQLDMLTGKFDLHSPIQKVTKKGNIYTLLLENGEEWDLQANYINPSQRIGPGR